MTRDPNKTTQPTQTQNPHHLQSHTARVVSHPFLPKLDATLWVARQAATTGREHGPFPHGPFPHGPVPSRSSSAICDTVSLRVERQCSLDLLGVPVQVMTKSTNTGQETEGVSSSMRAGKSWRDLSEPGIVPPGFRVPTFGQSMDSLLAAQLMKDALCEAIQGGNVRLQEVLAPHPCPRPALLRHTHAPRAPDPQPGTHTHAPRAPDPQPGSIAAGCAGRVGLSPHRPAQAHTRSTRSRPSAWVDRRRLRRASASPRSN